MSEAISGIPKRKLNPHVAALMRATAVRYSMELVFTGIP